jgi:8-oxo-dGTP diphosphatase
LISRRSISILPRPSLYGFAGIDDSTNLDGTMARGPVLAAGGIVLRPEQPPLIAVVRLRKRDEWVLPKGKLDDGETPLAAARREVLEETGHDVTVHEFLGTLVYETNGRSKIVHYWRMEARGGQTRELMNDIRAVDWLPLDAALERLSRSSERAFLSNVGPQALLSFSRQTRPKAQAVRKRQGRSVVVPEPVPAEPLPPKSLPAPMPAEQGQPAAIAPSLAEAASGPAIDSILPAEPAASVADGPVAVIQADLAPQTKDVESTVDATAPAAATDAAAPAPPAGVADDHAGGVADRRRWSLARKLRDWLGLAA